MGAPHELHRRHASYNTQCVAGGFPSGLVPMGSRDAPEMITTWIIVFMACGSGGGCVSERIPNMSPFANEQSCKLGLAALMTGYAIASGYSTRPELNSASAYHCRKAP